MRVYPQLFSGSIAQFPYRVTRRRRTLLNEMADGRVVRFEDWGAASISWRLEYGDLTEAEWTAIALLHEESEGRLGTFAFFDPGRNLLAWSEDPGRDVWVKDPFVVIEPGSVDPFGGSEARQITNAGAVEQGFVQRLPIPDNYATAWSVWMRSDTAQGVALIRGNARRDVRIGHRWQRYSHCGRGAGVETETAFGLVLPVGGVVEVFGGQVEAQTAPSDYKRNDQSTGMHLQTRFSTDRLECWADGPDRFRTVVNLESMAVTA
jgi:hypothetical protein